MFDLFIQMMWRKEVGPNLGTTPTLARGTEENHKNLNQNRQCPN
jgi:hypothetical protein